VFTARYGMNFFSSLTCEGCAFDLISLGEICGGRSGSGGGGGCRGTIFSHSTSVFPCRFHSTNTPYSSTSTFQKDDRAKARNALISDTVSEIEENWIAGSFIFYF